MSLDFFLKRGLDLLLSLILILITFIPMLIIGVMIKIGSKGPVLFRQERVGKDKKIFTIYKFRTMVVGAESVGDGIHVKDKDNRITKLGNVLRKLSLDELPQLFNVIKGDMSFVGPRPPVTYFPYNVSEYPEHWEKRFSVKPGITGLAQVNGRASIDWEQKVVFDTKYVETFSFWLDIKIIILTGLRILGRENIYRK